MNKYNLIIEGTTSNISISKDYSTDSKGIDYIHLKFKSSSKTIFPKINIKLFIPAIETHFKWNSKINLLKALNLDWFNNLNICNAFTGAPVECLMDYNNKNKTTIALSDITNTITFKSLVNEETAEFEYNFIIFENDLVARDSYELIIRIDTRNIYYHHAISDVSLWWETFKNNKPTPVPNIAKEAMYSSWYSFHQNLDESQLIEQCKLSKKLGCNSIIIDDGWQTTDNNRGYAFCGDWEVASSKFPSMKDFVKNVHKENMNILLWYSVPFIGKFSKSFEKFKDMLIDPQNERDWHVLDPRFPEVREYIIGIYEKALIDWDLDGFKLDFIDEFVVTPFSGDLNDPRRDFSSTIEATDKLLKDCIYRLKSIKNDIMLEFRQTYNGPLMRTYGNIFRAVDCPIDDLENRLRICDIRLLAGNSAVHSDMIMWNVSDTVESAALQFINIMFSVPQISMLIDKLPESHYEMLKFYCGIWSKYKNTLLDGDFYPLNPHLKYNLICSHDENTLICSYHNNEVIHLDKVYKNNIFINGSACNELHLINKSGTCYKSIKVYDCTGKILSDENLTLIQGYNQITVPKCGIVEIL